MTAIPETLLDRVILGDTTRSRQLVAEGWNVNHPDDFNRTYLHWAAQGNNADLIQLLLDCHADPHIRTKAGVLPLHTAINAGNTDAVRLLVAAGARLPDPENHPFDKYALHWAAARGDLEMVKLLVEKAEVGLTHVDSDGKTAAQTALAHGHRKVARYLAKKSGESLPEADGSDNETTIEAPPVKEITITVKREVKEEEEDVKGKKAGGKAKEKETGKKEEKPRAKRKKKEVSESEESESSESDLPVKRRKTSKKARVVESSSSGDETLESLSRRDEKGKGKPKQKKEKEKEKEKTKISLKIKVKDAPKKHKKDSDSEEEKPKKKKKGIGKEKEKVKGGKGVKNGKKKKGGTPDSPPPAEEKEEKKKKKKQNAHIYKELFKDDVFDVQTKIPKKKEKVDDSRADYRRPRDSYTKDRPMDRDRGRDRPRDWDR